MRNQEDAYRDYERREGSFLTDYANSRYKDNAALKAAKEMTNKKLAISQAWGRTNEKMRNSKQVGKYKLKEDKLPKHRQPPISRIRVDVSEFRNAHGKLPGSQRVGGSTRGNWAFKLGNETVFINDTYTGAKTKALKEASRRGLHSIKVLS